MVEASKTARRIKSVIACKTTQKMIVMVELGFLFQSFNKARKLNQVALDGRFKSLVEYSF